MSIRPAQYVASARAPPRARLALGPYTRPDQHPKPQGVASHTPIPSDDLRLTITFALRDAVTLRYGNPPLIRLESGTASRPTASPEASARCRTYRSPSLGPTPHGPDRFNSPLADVVHVPNNTRIAGSTWPGSPDRRLPRP